MSAMRLRVLLVEDNPPLRKLLALLFEGAGHRIDFAADGVQGLNLALGNPPDVLVLDLGLPRLDGLQVCRELRARADRHIPILMLTARDAVADKLQGFEAGADDYLTKPFSGEELLARCTALTRRHQSGGNHQIRIGSLLLDRRKGTASRAGRELQLNTTALRVLRVLAEAHPRPISRSELVEKIWGEEAPPSDPLRTHLHLLRKELDGPDEKPMLLNIHGVGYRLEETA
jgi:DNA-binding response OmpR family regulator